MPEYPNRQFLDFEQPIKELYEQIDATKKLAEKNPKIDLSATITQLENSIVEKAELYDFPDSVLDFMNGKLGVPEGGFPEPLRTKILKGKAPIVKDGERPG
jgi:pyruvate carboxylase